MPLHLPITHAPRRATAAFIGLAALLISLSASSALAQQVSDIAFIATLAPSPWEAGDGPVLVLDEAHFNFHTVAGRYAAFARVAARTGLRVRSGTTPFSDQSLADVQVLVIANALNAVNDGGRWVLPTPSAFTDGEIAAVVRFVKRGGGLLLVADHMPFGGAAAALADAIGIEWLNGFAFDGQQNGLLTVRRGVELRAHAVTNGTADAERIDSLRVFTGSALRLRAPGDAVLALPAGVRVLLPDSAWAFPPGTRTIDGAGWLVGAARRIGRGRVFALGEAAMLSAQRQGPDRRAMGFNDPAAPQNAQFVANVLRWLGGPERDGAP